MKVELFSSPQCTYCEQAKKLLTEKRISFETLDIASDERYREELLRRLPSVRALPQIFIDGSHIGGLEDLEILLHNGKLDEMIGAAGADR